jgi:hypothetical protein
MGGLEASVSYIRLRLRTRSGWEGMGSVYEHQGLYKSSKTV